MKILKLTAENFKRLRAVEIEPRAGGSVVQITGRNGQGKSSVLDAIWAALGGKDACPEQPVREGEPGARIELDLGDLKVVRRFTEGGETSLVVTSDMGTRYPKPQAVLDELVGRLTFNPLAFMRQDPKAQGETLRQLTGLDFAALDAQRRDLYDQRTLVNREVKGLESQGRAVVVPDGAPDAEVSAEAILAELEAAQLTNRQNKGVRDALAVSRSRVTEGEAEVAALRDQLADAETRLKSWRAQVQDQADIVATLKDADEAPIRAKLGQLTQLNEAARAKGKRRDLARAYKAKQQESEALSKSIEELDQRKAAQLGAAKMPVEGLSLAEDGRVLLKGLPLAQASSAEQLRVSTAMALALNPKLRIALIHDGSLLDSDSLAIVAEMARAADAQVWVEAVTDGEPCGIVIEDGMVREVVP